MQQIIIPVFLQVLLTMGILAVLGFLRYRSVEERTVNPKDYVLMTGQSGWPVMIQRLGRAFHNQLEVPILFYVLVVLILVTGIQSTTLLYMAWGYVGLRYIHAFIHISYNNVLHRFGMFIISCGWLLAMWVVFMWQQMSMT